MNVGMVTVDLIQVGRRLRKIDPDQVERLKESITEVGLINPITVYRSQVIRRHIAVDGFKLVAGAHRLEACLQLGHTEIPAHITDHSQLRCDLMQVQENLRGTKLTTAERAVLRRQEKNIYIALYPETRHGANQHTRSRQNVDSSPDRYTADAAKATGVTERTVQRECRRGEAIDEEVLADIKGTDLDKGKTLDALAKVPKPQQREALEALRAGEVVDFSKYHKSKPTAQDEERLAEIRCFKFRTWPKLSPDQQRKLADWCAKHVGKTVSPTETDDPVSKRETQ